MPISISKLPEVTNVKDNSFMLITQDGTTKRTMCDQFVTEEEARLDEFSPTVIVSKSMSKTGEGDNIDYSSSVYDAPMKDVILKGKTLVNCIQEPSSQDVVLPYEFEDGQYVTINDTKEGGALGVELKGQTLVNLFNTEDIVGSNGEMTIEKGIITLPIKNHRYNNFNIPKSKCTMFKPSTKYTMWVNMLENRSEDNEGETQQSGSFWLQTYDYSSSIVKTSNQGAYSCRFENNEVGVKTCVFETHAQNEYDSKSGGLNFDLPCYYAKNGGIQRVSIVIMEGDWGNQKLPFDKFFTGMTSCKMPILHTTGKNLCGAMESGSLTQIEGEPASHTSRIRTVDYIPIDGSYWISTETSTVLGLRYYDINKNCIGYPTVNTSTSPINVTNIPSGAKYLKFTVVDVTDVNYKIYLTKEQHTIGEYEPYKTSILSLPEEVVLRSLPNGVCDTFNTRTGEYVQRIGEITLDENTRHTFNNNNSDNVNVFYFDNIAPNKKFTGYAQESQRLIQCDSLKTGLNFNRWDSTESEYSLANSAAGFWIFVPKSIPQSWLAQNPVVVQYQLENPIVTKINLPSTLKSWNTITHIYSEIPENTLYPTLSHSNPSYPVILKPSTKYSIVANSYSNDHTNSAINFNLGGSTASTTVGNRVTTITTPSTLSNELLTMSGRGNKLNNVMVIEGDVAGDEPYFEGICDCKTPILLNVGKNLFNINGEINEKFSNVIANNAPNTVDGNTIIASSWTGNHHGKGQKIRVKRGKLYTCSFTTSDNGNVIIHTPNKVNFTSVKSSTFTFTAPTDCDEIVVAFNTSGASSGGKIHNLCVVEGDVTSVEYEPYKSNTTTFEQKDDKTIVLRSLPNGVCDTLNVETGEYVQRIGEVVLNGSESWVADNVNLDTRKNFSAYTTIADKKDGGQSSYGVVDNATLNDKLCQGAYDYLTGSRGDNEGSSGMIQKRFLASIAKSKLPTQNLAGFKTYLQFNPITVQYELETPIVTTIDVQGFPYAYKDGHVQLSSGHNGQSLTPKVEYNIATNRGGQITQNTKSLIRQGKLLDDIENKINQIIEATINDSIMLMKLRNK